MSAPLRNPNLETRAQPARRTLSNDVDEDALAVPAVPLGALAAVEGVDEGRERVDERPGDEHEAQAPELARRREDLDLGDRADQECEDCRPTASVSGAAKRRARAAARTVDRAEQVREDEARVQGEDQLRGELDPLRGDQRRKQRDGDARVLPSRQHARVESRANPQFQRRVACLSSHHAAATLFPVPHTHLTASQARMGQSTQPRDVFPTDSSPVASASRSTLGPSPPKKRKVSAAPRKLGTPTYARFA